jgi:hypothetical protein
MALWTCYIVLAKPEGLLQQSTLGGLKEMNSREKRSESANLSSSFEKCVYYGTSFNMYQWHTPSDEMHEKKVREFDF